MLTKDQAPILLVLTNSGSACISTIISDDTQSTSRQSPTETDRSLKDRWRQVYVRSRQTLIYGVTIFIRHLGLLIFHRCMQWLEFYVWLELRHPKYLHLLFTIKVLSSVHLCIRFAVISQMCSLHESFHSFPSLHILFVRSKKSVFISKRLFFVLHLYQYIWFSVIWMCLKRWVTSNDNFRL